MNRSAMRTLLLLLLIGLAVSTADAQRHPPPRGGLSGGAGVVFFEAAQFPSDTAGLARVDVFIRVPYEFMVFEKSQDPLRDSLYHGGVEVGTYIRRDGKTLTAEFTTADASAEGYQSTHLRDRYVLVHHVFHVAPGRYEILFTAADRNSMREYKDSRPLRVADLQGDSLRIGTPISLTRESADGRDRYGVYGYAGAIPFAVPVLIGIPTSRTADVAWHVRLTRPVEDEEAEVLYDQTVQPGTILRNQLPPSRSGEVDRFALREAPTVSGALVLLELPFSSFDIGRYVLDVIATAPHGADSIHVPVRIFWRDMPRSLHNIAFAIDAMRYILTSEEFDEMRDGDDDEMRAKFHSFWKAKDPTPGTEYNEMMTEYFHRVDEAMDKFHTLYQRNGAMTDRGKVYILFGPPEEVQRVLNIDEPAEEIWYYPSLDKTFRFIDRDHNGDFKLTEE